MLKLFWHCLDLSQSDEQFVEKSLCELSDFLKKPPLRIRLKVDRLPEKYRQNELVCSPCSDQASFTTWCKRICCTLLNHYPLLVYCKKDSKVAEAAIKENDRAIWGLCQDYYSVSAVYESNNKYILWHEVLHLFEVCDCYCYCNPNAGTNCDLTNCIMQYAPTPQTVGEWPFLCEKNIKRIRACNETRSTSSISDGR